MNNNPVMSGYFTIITLCPNSGIGFEIGTQVFFIVRVIPEIDGGIREGFGADQLTFLLANRFALFIPYFYRHPQTATLDLTLPDWQAGVAEHKAGEDIGAAGN